LRSEDGARGSGAIDASLPVVARRIRTRDGTELACYAGGNRRGPAMVLCGGLGGSARIWRPFFERFADRFRLLSWDYRGLYRSGPARDPGAYDMAHHVADLVDLLGHEGVDAPILVGWSMGVQLGLELHRAHARLPAALVAIHGTSGRPLASAFDSRVAERLAPYVLGALRRVGDRFGLVGPTLARTPLVVGAFVRASQRLGLMADTIDVEAFREIAEEWTRLDLRVYAEIFERLGDHDASDLLPSIETPALVVAGEGDRLTPAHLARRMASELPKAKLAVVPGATHFGLLEQPGPILGAVEQFLAELGFPGGSTP
jgi:pimeloyl-ACP methyl ester carboxylesterase